MRGKSGSTLGRSRFAYASDTSSEASSCSGSAGSSHAAIVPTQRLMGCPVIAAVKNEQDLAAALESECEAVFFLFGTILSIAGLVQRVKAVGKVALVHADLVEGLGNREIAVDALKALCGKRGFLDLRIRPLREPGSDVDSATHRLLQLQCKPRLAK